MLDLLKKMLPQLGNGQRCCCFHFGRCGSTVLGNMLNAHSSIHWSSEIFHEFHERADDSKDQSEPIQILQDTIRQNTLPLLGIEVKFQHLDANGLNLTFEDFFEVVVELGFQKFIVLKRNNFLRQAISVARGQQSKTWHVKSDDPKPVFSKVDLDLEQVGLGGQNREIIHCFEHLDHCYSHAVQVIEKAGLNLLELNYEVDLESDPFVGYEKTIDFLGLRLEKPTVSLQKLGGSSIQEMIQDFPAVTQRLQNTPYAWMLDS